jgi:hypothetical protein
MDEPSETLSLEALRFIELMGTEIAIFHGYRQLWAEGVANGRVMPLSPDALMAEQRKQVHRIAYLALAAYAAMYPGRSPHAHFVHRVPASSEDRE